MLVELNLAGGGSVFVKPEHTLAVHSFPGGDDYCEVVFSWMRKSECYRIIGTAAEVAAKLNAGQSSPVWRPMSEADKHGRYLLRIRLPREHLNSVEYCTVEGFWDFDFDSWTTVAGRKCDPIAFSEVIAPPSWEGKSGEETSHA